MLRTAHFRSRVGVGLRLVVLALALLALAFASLTVAALVLATLRGLRDGAWLAPEQVALSVAAPPDH